MPNPSAPLPDSTDDSALAALVAPEHNPAATSLSARQERTYDFIAVGGGTAGLVAATGAAALGLRVAVIERDLLGGDCLVTGCVPSKALLHVAKLAHQARHAAAAGVQTGTISADFAQVMRAVAARRLEIAQRDSVRSFQERGVDVIAGEARFVGKRTLRVGSSTLRFKRALIATGARPALPDIPGLSAVQPLTSRSLFSLKVLPKRLAVIGGGPIGCEMAQAFARLGAQVTLVERGPQLLPADDPKAGALLREVFSSEGVTVRTGCELVGAKRTPQAEIALALRSADTTDQELRCDHVLIATGRLPNIEPLGLGEAGVAFDARGVRTDRRGRTTNPRVYAAGDVSSPKQFTHAAWAQAEYAVLNALFPLRLNAAGRVLPHTTFTSPEVARVGLSAPDIAALGERVDVITTEVAENDRAVTEGERRGFARVWLKRGSAKILAATVVAENAGELIVPLCVAMTHQLPLTKLADVVLPYPTRAELVRDLAYAYNFQRITPPLQRWVRRWVSLLR